MNSKQQFLKKKTKERNSRRRLWNRSGKLEKRIGQDNMKETLRENFKKEYQQEQVLEQDQELEQEQELELELELEKEQEVEKEKGTGTGTGKGLDRTMNGPRNDVERNYNGI